MKVLLVILTILGVIAVSTGCVFAQIYFAKKKSKLWGLIPVGGLFVVALITFIILIRFVQRFRVIVCVKSGPALIILEMNLNIWLWNIKMEKTRKKK